MADFPVHIAQAQHNEGLAIFLLDKPFFDWSITACFYSAIHFFEARLFFDANDNSNKHSESSIPAGLDGKFKYSSHSWRAKQIQESYPREAWKAFRSLKEASETARYLSHYINIKEKTVHFEKVPSFDIFRIENSKFAVEKDLSSFKNALKIELLEFLYSLDIITANPIQGPFIVDKILLNFNNKENFLSQTKESLREYLSKENADLLVNQLSLKGHSLKE